MQKKIIKTKNITITTSIPAPGTKQLMNKLNKVESRSMHGQLPIAWSKAKNFNIYDIAGNKFIDFTSTIFVANVGHSNDRVKKYINRSLKSNFIHSYAYINKIRAEYIDKLVKFCGKGFQKAFLMSAGTEATEAAFKLMRMYGQKKKKRKLGIVCFDGNWHGRTMAAQMMSGNINQKKWIGFHDKDIHHIPFPYPWLIKNGNEEEFLNLSIRNLKKKLDLNKDVCGFMLETFQGWGALFYPKKYVKLLSKICKQNDILLTFDEMQSGFGRTGKNFGFQHYGIIPDLICCGKGMGGGVALSGVVGKKNIMDLPEVGNMSSTNSANPLACSAGLAVLEEIQDKKLTDKAKINGQLMHKKLLAIKKKHPNLFNVYGKGLIAAIIFNKSQKNINKKLKLLVEKCMKDGLLLVYTGRESVKIGPPLTITKSAIIEGTQIIEKNINLIFNK
jgi:4-aminobutyrate aminotransferase-like enzyme